MDAEKAFAFSGGLRSTDDIRNFSYLKADTMAKINYLLGVGDESAIEAAEDEFFKGFRSKKGFGKDGEEIRFLKGYEKSVLVVGKFIQQDALQMTVFRFLEAGNLMKEYYKEQKKRNNR